MPNIAEPHAFKQGVSIFLLGGWGGRVAAICCLPDGSLGGAVTSSRKRASESFGPLALSGRLDSRGLLSLGVGGRLGPWGDRAVGDSVGARGRNRNARRRLCGAGWFRLWAVLLLERWERTDEPRGAVASFAVRIRRRAGWRGWRSAPHR